MDRDLDVVVFGATGFAGRLVAEHLAAHAPAGVRPGLAGRSREKLERVRDELGVPGWELLVADSGDPASLAALAGATRVVATTVGPYWPGGLALVEACAGAGTDYADLTGEILFVRASIDRHDDAARASGARIVHSCGFDSIPSDLGTLALHQAAGDELEAATLVVTAMRGGFSGGTLASMKGQLAAVRENREHRRVVADPYALSPDRAAEPDLGPQRDLDRPVRDDELGTWLGPFVMAPFNTRVVRRSNALQGWAYGKRLRYREVMGFGSGYDGPVKAAAVTAGLAALAGGLSFGPTRDLLDRFLPAPGEGPSEESRNRGHFRMEIHGRTASGAQHVAHVAARGDPGYAATAVMLGETALCLARDRERLPDRAGVLTPATALGEPLADRLRAKGFTLQAR
jgi:short subunit dehydrogenase-like uncharacterized protein